MTTAIKRKTLSKKKTKVFNKTIYLLGQKKNGKYVWLEEASWDCSWYWGFGYLEEYTNNKSPENSRDITCHTHWDSSIIGKQEEYDHDKGCWELSDEYIHHLNEHPNFEMTVLTDKESWALADLMKTFYTLKDTAELFHSGNSHISDPGLSLKDKRRCNYINKVLLPKVFEKVYEILSPINGEKNNDKRRS